jgi:chromosome segregation ATPase
MAMKAATRDALLNKRAHYAGVIEAHKSKTTTLSSTLGTLISRTVSAELNLKRAVAQVNRSARRSDDVAEINSALEQRVKNLEASLKREQQQRFDLEEQLEEKSNEVKELQVVLEQAAPVKVFGKIKGSSGRRGGASSWPHLFGSFYLSNL